MADSCWLRGYTVQETYLLFFKALLLARSLDGLYIRCMLVFQVHNTLQVYFKVICVGILHSF